MTSFCLGCQHASPIFVSQLFLDLRRKEKEIDMDKIMFYRNDVDNQYTLFMKEFVPCVAGKKLWNDLAQRTTVLSELVTQSDEALAIVLLLNSKDRWEEMFLKELRDEEDGSGTDEDNHPNIGDNATGRMDVATSRKRKQWDNLAKYTMDCKRKKGKEFGGWNNEGKRMFNKLKDDIKEDREINKDWEKVFLHTMVTQAPQRINCRQRRDLTEQLEVVHTNHDIVFSDSDSESESDEADGNGPLRANEEDEYDI